MTSISRSQINVLFLDEVNQALDEVGKEKSRGSIDERRKPKYLYGISWLDTPITTQNRNNKRREHIVT